MNKIKSSTAIIISFLILITLSNVAKAQDAAKILKGSTPGQRAQMQTGLMKSKLNLDSVQTTKVEAINLKYAQKLDQVLKSDERKFKMMRNAMSVQKAKDAELKTALSGDQYQQYEKMKEEMKEKLKDYKKP